MSFASPPRSSENLSRRTFRNFLLVAEAIVWLLISKLCLKTIPFVWIGRYVGPLHSPVESEITLDERNAGVARDVSWAIQRAASAMPITFVCLPRALAAWQMLALREVRGRIHFGAAKTSGSRLQTHAWLDAAGVSVTGYPVAHEFVEIGFYARCGASR